MQSFMDPMPNTSPNPATVPLEPPPAPLPAGRVPVNGIVAMFGLANVISVPIIGARNPAIFFMVLITALYASELVLLGVWCALGRAAYWIRLLMTAVGVGALFLCIFLGIIFQRRAFEVEFRTSILEEIFLPFWIIATSIVIVTAISVVFLKFTGMKTYHLHEFRAEKDTALPGWQFSIADIFLTTTAAAIVAAVWGHVIRSFPGPPSDGEIFFGIFMSMGVFGGGLMLSGVIGMLAVLLRGNPAWRVVGYCGLMSIPAWVVAFLTPRAADVGPFLLCAAFLGAFILGTFGVLRADGLRVTWSKIVPGQRSTHVGASTFPTPPLLVPRDNSLPNQISEGGTDVDDRPV